MGAALGGLTPFCSCSTILMMAGMLKTGVGFGPTMSLLFASPLINPVLVGLFFTLLGGKITLVYSFVALALAVLSGFILEHTGFSKYLINQISKGEGEGCSCEPETELAVVKEIQPITTIEGFADAESTGTSKCCGGTSGQVVVEKTTDGKE